MGCCCNKINNKIEELSYRLSKIESILIKAAPDKSDPLSIEYISEDKDNVYVDVDKCHKSISKKELLTALIQTV